jgi:hypothetical protein
VLTACGVTGITRVIGYVAATGKVNNGWTC